MSDYNVKIENIKRSLCEFLKSKTTDIYSAEHCYREFTADDLVFEMQKYYISKFEEEFTNLKEEIEYLLLSNLSCKEYIIKLSENIFKSSRMRCNWLKYISRLFLVQFCQNFYILITRVS